MIFSIYHGLVEETAYVHVSCSCEWNCRCSLGFVEVATPEPGPMEHA